MALRVLLIDDDARLAELLSGYLAQHDVVLGHARDGVTGLARLDADAFDAVLLDVMMPGVDGLEVLRRLRHKSRFMHMQGTPQNMQMNPQYRNIVSEVKDFLQQRIEICIKAGIERHRLIIDPGFGFGKTLQHNLTLLNHLEQLSTLKIPILAGLSRKSMLGAITGNPVEQRIHESITAALLAIIKGAKIIRVHDVKASKDALTTLTSIQNSDINP